MVFPDLHGALTGPGALGKVRGLLQSRHQRHGLIDGAGRKRGGEKTVDIGAFIAVVGLDVRRHVHRIIAGRGNHAQDLAGFIIVYRHGTRVTAQRLIRLVIIAGVDGEIQIAAGVGAKGAVEQIVTGELIGKCVEGTGADVALQVSHRVERGLADIHIIIISALSVVCHGGEHVSVPVQHRTA